MYSISSWKKASKKGVIVTKKNDFIGFRVSENIKESLEIKAKEAGMSVSSLLQNIVAEYLDEKEIKMQKEDLMKSAVKSIIKDYDNISELEKKNLVENIRKPLLDAIGSWAFLFQYIPDELTDKEDKLSLEEIAIIRAAQLYFYHRDIAREEVHIDNNQCYLKPIDLFLRNQPQGTNFALKRLWSFTSGFGVDTIISNFLYFVDLIKGDFKADYVKLASDLLNVEISGKFPIDFKE